MEIAQKSRPQRRQRKYSAQFKSQVVAEYHATDKTIAGLARDYDLVERSIRNWIREAEVRMSEDEDPSNAPLTNDERAELKRLRKQVKQLKEDNGILSRAVAFFDKETR